jgi:hypothetical protein
MSLFGLAMRLRTTRATGVAGWRDTAMESTGTGHALHRKSGQWNILSRLIDREQDTYDERIDDGETGMIIRELREPLSKHSGRGSAKRRSPS